MNHPDLTSEEAEFMLHLWWEVMHLKRGPAWRFFEDQGLHYYTTIPLDSAMEHRFRDRKDHQMPRPTTQECPMPWKTKEELLQRVKEFDPKAELVPLNRGTQGNK